jgi:DedD protein
MIKGMAERSSAFVVVSRKALISGMAGIAVLSFGLGYFLGYGGPSSEKMVRHVQADNKVVPSEEKTVLDSSGKPTFIMPPSTPDVIPKEPVQRPAEQGRAASKPEDQQKKMAAAPPKIEIIDVKKDVNGMQSKGDVAPGQNARTPQGKEADKQIKPDKPQEKQTPAAVRQNNVSAEQPQTKLPANAKIKNRPTIRTKIQTKKSYSVQAGSFHDVKKARMLKERLDEKGYKSYIVIYSPKKGSKFSRVRLGPFETRDEADGIIPELKELDLEGIIVPGQR